MKILLLGAAGFIGTNLTIELAKKTEDEITLVDRSKAFFKPIVSMDLKNVHILEADLTVDMDFDSILKDQEVVYHLVSTTVPTTSNQHISQELVSNVIFSANLFEACIRCGVKKVVFVSSGGTVYGKEVDCPLKEKTATNPISSYGVQKITIEKLLYLYRYIPEIARALDVQGVQTPQVQMAKKKRSRTKIKWPDSTIRSILKNPLYIGKCTLTLAKAKRELEVPAIVSKTEFQKAQKKLESTRLPSRKKARKKPNLLFKKIYDKESGKGLLCRTSEDESQQIYSFDKGYRCFSGKAPFIESEKIFREILSALEKEKMQAVH